MDFGGCDRLPLKIPQTLVHETQSPSDPHRVQLRAMYSILVLDVLLLNDKEMTGLLTFLPC